MKPLSESLALLLLSDQALTIQRTDDGFFITLSDLEEDDEESPIFVPTHALVSSQPLDEALEAFQTTHAMLMMERFNA